MGLDEISGILSHVYRKLFCVQQTALLVGLDEISRILSHVYRKLFCVQ